LDKRQKIQTKLAIYIGVKRYIELCLVLDIFVELSPITN
jgi:hypothetical protein